MRRLLLLNQFTDSLNNKSEREYKLKYEYYDVNLK